MDGWTLSARVSEKTGEERGRGRREEGRGIEEERKRKKGAREKEGGKEGALKKGEEKTLPPPKHPTPTPC